MYPSKGKTASFTPVFCVGLKVGVEKEVVIRRNVPEETWANGKDLFFAVLHIHSIDLTVGDLLKVVAIKSNSQGLGITS